VQSWSAQKQPHLHLPQTTTQYWEPRPNKRHSYELRYESTALFAWRELSLGKLRFLVQLEILVALAIALVGVGTFVFGGPANKWMFYNNLLDERLDHPGSCARRFPLKPLTNT
jgi:hypothetical protein